MSILQSFPFILQCSFHGAPLPAWGQQEAQAQSPPLEVGFCAWDRGVGDLPRSPRPLASAQPPAMTQLQDFLGYWKPGSWVTTCGWIITLVIQILIWGIFKEVILRTQYRKSLIHDPNWQYFCKSTVLQRTSAFWAQPCNLRGVSPWKRCHHYTKHSEASGKPTLWRAWSPRESESQCLNICSSTSWAHLIITHVGRNK